MLFLQHRFTRIVLLSFAAFVRSQTVETCGVPTETPKETYGANTLFEPGKRLPFASIPDADLLTEIAARGIKMFTESEVEEYCKEQRGEKRHKERRGERGEKRHRTHVSGGSGEGHGGGGGGSGGGGGCKRPARGGGGHPAWK